VESYCLLLIYRNETCENPPFVERIVTHIKEEHADNIGKITLASNIKPKETKPQYENTFFFFFLLLNFLYSTTTLLAE